MTTNLINIVQKGVVGSNEIDSKTDHILKEILSLISVEDKLIKPILDEHELYSIKREYSDKQLELTKIITNRTDDIVQLYKQINESNYAALYYRLCENAKIPISLQCPNNNESGISPVLKFYKKIYSFNYKTHEEEKIMLLSILQLIKDKNELMKQYINKHPTFVLSEYYTIENINYRSLYEDLFKTDKSKLDYIEQKSKNVKNSLKSINKELSKYSKRLEQLKVNKELILTKEEMKQKELMEQYIKEWKEYTINKINLSTKAERRVNNLLDPILTSLNEEKTKILHNITPSTDNLVSEQNESIKLATNIYYESIKQTVNLVNTIYEYDLIKIINEFEKDKRVEYDVTNFKFKQTLSSINKFNK
jgi:hypothetical protein